jgi:hypothetical protein
VRNCLKRGRHVLLENPLASQAWTHPRFQWMRADKRFVWFRTDLCAHGLQDPAGQPLLKPTRNVTTSIAIASAAALRCPGPEEHPSHGEILGQPAGHSGEVGSSS